MRNKQIDEIAFYIHDIPTTLKVQNCIRRYNNATNIINQTMNVLCPSARPKMIWIVICSDTFRWFLF